MRLIFLRKNVADFGSAGDYMRFRKELSTHAINPWLRRWMEERHDEQAMRCEALVSMRNEQGCHGIFDDLLDFSESFVGEPDKPDNETELSVDEWLREFRPENRNDFLMALPLYGQYRETGEVLRVIDAKPDPWLDAFLKDTRGMLFWMQQWVELFRIVGDIGRREAQSLVQGYLLDRQDALVRIKKIRYASTGSSLMQIIKERRVASGPFGAPDYLAGDWLQQYWFSRNAQNQSEQAI